MPTLDGLRERRSWLLKQVQICEAEIERAERAAPHQQGLPGVPAPTPAQRGRKVSESEQWWENLELNRLAFSERKGLGLKPEPRPPAAAINTILARAIEVTGFVDREVRGRDGQTSTLSKWTQLEDLQERYFNDEKFGTLDRDGNKRVPPWPLKLFLTPGVLEKYKRDAELESPPAGDHP